MTAEWLEKKQKEISVMGLFELKDYKSTVVNSLLENPSKFFLYDLIDERMAALDTENAMAVQDSDDIEFNYWSEK